MLCQYFTTVRWKRERVYYDGMFRDVSPPSISHRNNTFAVMYIDIILPHILPRTQSKYDPSSYGSHINTSDCISLFFRRENAKFLYFHNTDQR